MNDDTQQVLSLLQGNRLNEAKTLCASLCERNPNDAEAWFLLGAINGQRGDLNQAEECFLHAVANNPKLPVAHYNLGSLLQNKGQLEQAAAHYRQAIMLNPSYLEAHFNLAAVLQMQGDLDRATAQYREVLVLNPSLFQAHLNLGIVLQQQGDLDAAVGHYRQAVALNPAIPETHNNLGTVLQALGRHEEAADSYRQVLRIKPDYAQAHANLGLALWQMGRLEDAAASCGQALAHNPQLAQARNTMALVLWELGRLEEAAESCRQALTFDPSYAEAYNTLGTILKDQGQPQQAIAQYRRAIEADADFARAHSNLLFTLNYVESVDSATVFAEHLRWAQQYAVPLQKHARRHSNDPVSGRRLRIGYVSPDFCRHSVASFIEPVLAAHDREVVEVYGYANVARPDAMTARLRGLADHWRDISGMNDLRAADLIREDRIDILVDLAGHTAGNRLLLFARKPAPVQATYLGYLNTTGMAAMDYRLTDTWADPQGEGDRWHTETLVRLPNGLLCFGEPIDCPPVAESPAVSSGRVTFGCFNNSAKITPEVIALWCEILRSVPDSHLLLKSKQLADAATQRHYRELFLQHGVEPERVEMAGNSKWQEYLESYHRIDIALDPFPYAGGTITCHALWMGVPVITFAGLMGFGRTGVSILSSIGLSELIADTRGTYLAKAAALSADVAYLQQLRAGMRDRMRNSPLMDSARWVVSLEDCYRRMWSRWCSQEAGESEFPGHPD